MQFQYKYFLYLIDVGVSDVTVMLILGKQASVMSETISKKKKQIITTPSQMKRPKISNSIK